MALDLFVTLDSIKEEIHGWDKGGNTVRTVVENNNETKSIFCFNVIHNASQLADALCMAHMAHLAKNSYWPGCLPSSRTVRLFDHTVRVANEAEFW